MTKKITYKELAYKVGEMILNNNIIRKVEGFELYSGSDYDEETEECAEVYQTYIINSSGAEYLKDYTNEIVYYNDELDMYVWGITHYGTSWDSVDLEVNYN